ncbi:sugar phosphate isomerase/epimerase [Leucobacter luti]|uniref:Sugar phosphate isomerase/epimerase n=1 Tax=Leucobacter luti TaxID=340320 RepID=A0A4R6S213_9MICO|nr:sugar phosphate isomerase/epimerase [Leucobacter luti]TDP93303.1 sugar phosphate isomerase/epimerase [Leucobacter luti]
MTTPPQLMATCWTTAGTAMPGPGTGRSPLRLKDRIAAAAAGGWRGFGVVHSDLAAYLERGTLTELRGILADHGITQLELELIEDWWTEDERRPESDRIRRELLTAAEALGAQTIKIGPETSSRAVDPDRFAASFDALATEAAEHGTRVAFEFLPFASYGDSLKAGIDLVTQVANPAGGLCVDIWHVARPGTDYTMIAESLPSEYLFSVELNDAAAAPIGTLFEDTVQRRLLPGTGSFDVPAFINAVRAAGFTGMWGVEMLSDRHRSLPLERGLAEAREATLACFAEANRRLTASA